MHYNDVGVICIGAGPAGLTTAYILSKHGIPVTVLEADQTYVGGISRTVKDNGFRFDIGGHRFFSKSEEVEKLWDEILGDDFIERPRKSRIFYKKKLFDYPLKAFDALSKLGIIEAALCVLSYGKARLLPVRDPRSFEDWVCNKFGRRLFRIFFQTYTEKVWGMKCSEISADWAAQRIKGLSLSKAILSALLPQRGRSSSNMVKTLIDRFRYPRLGPGMMWEAARDKINAAGGFVILDRKVTKITRIPEGWMVTAVDAQGSFHHYHAGHVVSSAPIKELMGSILPVLPNEILNAANGLRYRDFLTVALRVRDRKTWDDNWIYIHDPSVQVGRIQNFKSWSPELVPDADLNCLGLEYFCFEGDGLWTSSNEDLVALASKEVVQLGLVKIEDILGGTVIRQPKAYPVYDEGYLDKVGVIRKAIKDFCPGIHLVGRNGMHMYNNQDHAMMTGMLVAKNIIAGTEIWDPWLVNNDAEYHEVDSGKKAEYNPVPAKIS